MRPGTTPLARTGGGVGRPGTSSNSFAAPARRCPGRRAVRRGSPKSTAADSSNAHQPLPRGRHRARGPRKHRRPRGRCHPEHNLRRRLGRGRPEAEGAPVRRRGGPRAALGIESAARAGAVDVPVLRHRVDAAPALGATEARAAREGAGQAPRPLRRLGRGPR